MITDNFCKCNNLNNYRLDKDKLYCIVCGIVIKEINKGV